MEREFWIQRWQEGQIGFHQQQVNEYLTRHWPKLGSDVKRVLVTLCGKSKDMLWLAEQGCKVTGVEISQLAVEAFFSENKLAVEKTEKGNFIRYDSGAFSLWCGDFFSLQASDIEGIVTVFDRASLIALPPSMRQQYAKHLASLLPSKSKVLLVTMEYPQEEMNGPPFAVHKDEVMELYQSTFDLECLEESDILALNPQFRERGLSQLKERIWLMTRK
ncbi:MAG: thiopurine S-methyltransferase [Gammaproteobacteria bacterium]|nr:thiopurine S-methyltransferase [Gammaproteobacteria bacterium]